MSVNTNALTQYVENNSTTLMHKGLLASRTVQLIDVRGGIKSKQHTFSIESGTLVVQGANCGLVPSGSTSINPITIDIDRLAVRESVCQDTLEDYFASSAFKSGQNRDDASMGVIGAQFIGEKVAAIGNEIDRLIWQGNKTTGTGNLSKTDGFLATLVTVSASTANIAKTALTESNAIAITKAYFDALPSAAKTRTDLVMFVGVDEFIYLQSALVPSYYPASAAEGPAVMSVDFKYRPMRIEACTGLNGTGRKVVGPKSFFKMGTDLASDMPNLGQSGLRFWFSNDDEIHYFQSRWAMGVGIAIPSFVVNDIL